MSAFKDITGLTYGDLTAVQRVGSTKNKGATWLFKCICGEEKVLSAGAVKKGDILSCGCRWIRKGLIPKICKICGGESVRKTPNGHIGRVCHKCAANRVYHYQRKNPKHYMVNAAKGRAKDQGLPFSITAEDFDIPEFCPVLGIPLKFGKMGDRENSPSIDKMIPELGYVPGNITIMSFRANRFKNDATAEELRMIADWIDSKTKIELVA